MATTSTKNPQARNVVGKHEEGTLQFSFNVVQEDRDTINELTSQSQAAYASYMQAQRKVAAAYQQRQRRVEESFKDVEEHAAKTCAVAIQKAEIECYAGLSGKGE